MHRPILILAAIAGVAVIACQEGAATAPEGSAAFDAPAVYAKWWSAVEECSEHSADLSSVSWFMAPTGQPLMLKGEPVEGYWEAKGDFVVLSDGTKYAGALVRHEMLHALIGNTRHPRPYFLERCAGEVSCGPSCIADAEPITVPAETPVVPPDSIEVWSTLEPSTPMMQIDSGFFTVTVWAYNRRSHAVSVKLPPSGDPSPSLSFGYHIDAAAPLSRNDRAFDASSYYFRPGETKKRVFDLAVKGTIQTSDVIMPGVYQVAGTYGPHPAPKLWLSIGR